MLNATKMTNFLQLSPNVLLEPTNPSCSQIFFTTTSLNFFLLTPPCLIDFKLHSTNPMKRTRPVHSCLQCRKRRLRCDKVNVPRAFSFTWLTLGLGTPKVWSLCCSAGAMPVCDRPVGRSGDTAKLGSSKHSAR